MERNGIVGTSWLTALLLGGLALLGTGRTARAEGVPTALVVVPTDKFSEKAAAILNHLGRENFSRAGEYEMVDIRKFLDEGSSDTRLDYYRKALEALREGREQYDNLELDPAIEALKRSLELFRKAAGRLGTGEQYMKALLFLGSAYILSGDNEQGTENFRLVAMFDKRKVLDKKIFPPSMIEIFNKVKADVATMPTGSVLVKSEPAGAEVYLNGVFKGITPLNVIKVPEGEHFLRLEKDGYLPWGKVVGFYATHEETVSANLQKSAGHLAFEKKTRAILEDLDEDPPEPGLLELAGWLRVEKLAVAKVTQRGDEVNAEAALIQVAPPKTLAHRSMTFNLTSPNFLSRADALFTSLYKQVEIPQAGKPAGKGNLTMAVARCNSDSDCTTGEVCDAASGRCIPYAPEKKAFYEKWWFWTLVGGGLAVAGGTAALVWYFTRPAEGAIEFSF